MLPFPPHCHVAAAAIVPRAGQLRGGLIQMHVVGLGGVRTGIVSRHPTAMLIGSYSAKDAWTRPPYA